MEIKMLRSRALMEVQRQKAGLMWSASPRVASIFPRHVTSLWMSRICKDHFQD
jgi:hypothetical protein